MFAASCRRSIYLSQCHNGSEMNTTGQHLFSSQFSLEAAVQHLTGCNRISCCGVCHCWMILCLAISYNAHVFS